LVPPCIAIWGKKKRKTQKNVQFDQFQGVREAKRSDVSRDGVSHPGHKLEGRTEPTNWIPEVGGIAKKIVVGGQ